MNICILSEFSISKYMEGTNRLIVEIAKKLVKKGNNVYILSPIWSEDKELKEKYYEINGIKIYRFGSKFTSNPLFRIISYIIEGIKIGLEKKIDMFYGAYTLPPAVSAVILGKIFKKKNYIAIYEPAACSKMNNPILNSLLSKTNGIITHTNAVKKLIINNLKVSEGVVSVISGFCDIHRFKPNSKDGKLKIKHNLKNKFVILFVGRISTLKGVPYLIQALSILKGSGIKNIKLLLVGREVEYENFRDMIKQLGLENIVELVGYIPDKELPKYYNLADCFVLPSLSEGFGLVVAEAMACKKPIIVSDTPPLPEVVDDAGIVVPQKNSKRLSEAIKKLMEDDDLRKRLSKNAIKRSKSFEKEKILSRYVNFLTSNLQT